MKRLLPQNFRFSWKITLICVFLAAMMVRASAWQWERYKYKVTLVQSYEAHSGTLPLDFPASGPFAELLHRKVEVSGSYDLEHQLIVTNRSHASGPGHWLLTPLELSNPAPGAPRHVLVSRGFIPFPDMTPESWRKYDPPREVRIEAVVQPTVPHRGLLAPGHPEQQGFARKWLYADIEKMAAQFPYPILTEVFLQKLGGPATGEFPAESVSIDVPPSTHFGYTIEWILLALATLVVGFLLQAFPRRRPGEATQRPVSLNGATPHLPHRN